MKTEEEYLKDYYTLKKELESKGELWKLTTTEEEYITAVNRLFQALELNSNSNSFAILTLQSEIALLLQGALTFEEVKSQADIKKKQGEERFANEAPEIQASLHLLKSPLDESDIRQIARWIFRKQITHEMLPLDVLADYKESRFYDEK